MASSSIYTVGGAVQAGGKNAVYISRRADEELFDLCRRSVFCYVLTPRQMGKTSLIVRIAERLAQEAGIIAINIDLQEFGTQVTAEQWYLGLLTKLEDELDLDTDVLAWWQERSELGVTQRLNQFFQEVLLTEIEEPIVIFVDEIDTTLSLDFTDDLYSAIRFLYLSRSLKPELRRLSFVLVGVATPSDLIRDPKRTPFNIGERVDLTDFTFEEALPLTDGLELEAEQGQQVLEWVLQWTRGHPYLTQRLFQALIEQERQDWSQATVDQVVERTFFGKESKSDSNLEFVRDMLTKRSPDLSEGLRTYREVLRGRKPVLDEEQSLVKSHLKLSGIVLREEGNLQVRNPIYRRVFDEEWVRKNLPLNWKKRWQHLSIESRLSILVIILFLLAPTPAAIFSYRQYQKAEEQRKIAAQGRDEAQIFTLITSAERHFDSSPGIASLIEAVKAGKKLQALEEKLKQSDPKSKVDSATKMRIVTALRQIVYDVVERNRLEHDTAVRSVSISRDDRIIAAAGDDGIIKLWNLDGSLKKTINAHQVVNICIRSGDRTIEETRGVTDISFSPDNQTIASVGADGSVKLWNLDGSPIKTLRESQIPESEDSDCQLDSFPFGSVSFSSDSQIIAFSGNENTVKLWKRDGSLITTLEGHLDKITDISFSKDNQMIATASLDNTVKLWKRDGTLIKSLEEHGDIPIRVGEIIINKKGVMSVDFSADNEMIASAGVDQTVKLWNLDGTLITSLTGHSDTVTSVSFSPDKQVIVATSKDRTIKLWQKDGTLIDTIESHGDEVNDISFSPNGKIVVSVSNDKWVKLWQLNDKRLATLVHSGLATLVHSGGTVWDVTFSPDLQLIASGGLGTVKLWDLKGNLINTFEGHTSFVYDVIFSPDGQLIVSASGDGTAKFWRRDGSLINTITEDENALNRINFSPDGQLIAHGSRDGIVKLSDRNGKLISTLEHGGVIQGISFSPDGDLIASSGNDKTIKLWDRKGHLIKTLEGHSDTVYNPNFSPNGQLIVSASNDGTVKLWHRDGRLLNTLNHNGWVHEAAFNPDGKIIASVGFDEVVRLWQTDGTLIASLRGHNIPILGLSFSPDGKTLASSDGDGKIILWDLNLDNLVVQGCNWLYNYLVTNPKVSDEEVELCPKAKSERQKKQNK